MMALAEVAVVPRMGLVLVVFSTELEAAVSPRNNFKDLYLSSLDHTVSFVSMISRVTGVEYSGVSKCPDLRLFA